MDLFNRRQGQTDVNFCYFYTNTIYQFRHLLAEDEFKWIVISSLQYLVCNELITLYGFVIMPNHVHLLWYIKKNNGKESTAGSFAKYTAHQFKRKLEKKGELNFYRSDKADRGYQFWKRDPLAIAISSENILQSKLRYIHNNPVQDRWRLCRYPEEYRWSSARFYYDGKDEFNMLTHYKE